VAKVNIVRPGEGEILGSGAQQIRILVVGVLAVLDRKSVV